MVRSYEPITLDDLRHLGRLALSTMENFIIRNRKYSNLKDKLIAIALCQGAALHYLNKTNGVKDFDVWFFFVHDGELEFPPRWIFQTDSKLTKFGRHPDDNPNFVGRRVDFLGRTICKHCKHYDGCTKQQIDPSKCLQGYLCKQATSSAKHLAEKAVVGIYPDKILGKIIWPLEKRV